VRAEIRRDLPPREAFAQSTTSEYSFGARGFIDAARSPLAQCMPAFTDLGLTPGFYAVDFDARYELEHLTLQGTLRCFVSRSRRIQLESQRFML
jgi:hypothetical protein